MTDPAYVLHYAPDNASLVIRLALEELGLPYRTRLVDRARAGQRDPAFLAINPGGKIPVLETPQGALFETAAILLWLSDRHGTLGPAPDDPARGDGLKWLFYLSNTLHPALRRLFYPVTYIGPDSTAQRHLAATTQALVLDHLAVLDRRFASARPGLILDLYLAPMLRWIALYPVESDKGWFDLRRFPALHATARATENRPATIAAGLAEGLGPTPFTAPSLSRPLEGSAT